MKKRIVHVTFDMGIGGAEQVIYNLIENTDSSAYEVSVLCTDQHIGAFGIQLQKKGYCVEAMSRKPGFDFSLIKKIHDYILSRKIDVLHCHQYTPYIYGLFGAALTPCKVIFTEHGRFYPDRRKLKRVIVNPFLSLMTAYITAISSATRDALIRFENFPSRKIKVVYNGISDAKYRLPRDTNVRKSLGISENAYILGTVARLDPIKNQKMMIKALKIVRRSFPETFLIIVGDGPERETLKNFASELQVSSHVVFTGFREDTHLFYRNMDMFLLTSFSEGTAMTLLEAMASCLPCIATNVGGNPEIVRDRETGFVIPGDNEEILAEKIIYLFEEKSMREKMGQAGRRRFEENFTAKKMAEAYQEMYKK